VQCRKAEGRSADVQGQETTPDTHIFVVEQVKKSKEHHDDIIPFPLQNP
jgi:hypothetical protein